MIGRLLPCAQYTHNKVTTSTSLQDTLHITTLYRTIHRLRIKITDNLHLSFTLPHCQSSRCHLVFLYIEEREISKYRTIGKAGPCGKHIITGIQSCTILQQIFPGSSTFIIVQQMKSTLFKTWQCKMRVILGIIEWPDRLINGFYNTWRCQGLFGHLKIHIEGFSILQSVISKIFILYFSCHLVYPGRNT